MLSSLFGSFAAISFAGSLNKIQQVGSLNCHYGSQIEPHNPANLEELDKISGTFIEVSAKLSLTGGAVPIEHWVKDVVVDLMMGGQTFEIFRRDALTTDPIGINCRFRFATTLGADGSEIKIRVRVTYVMQPQGYSQLTDFPSDQTYTFYAYNKLHLLGTNLNGFGQTNSFMQTASDGVATAAKNNLPTHTADPSGSTRSETKSSILAKVKPSTIACFVTHGTNTHIADSTHMPDAGSSYTLSFENEIGPEVAAKSSTRIPKYNIVALYCCNSLTSPVKATYAYDIGAVNQAYLGFAAPISAGIWSPAKWALCNLDEDKFPAGPFDFSIADHASEFWAKMASGKKVLTALVDANTAYPTHTGEIVEEYEIPVVARPTPMEKLGDDYTRIKYVYLTAAQTLARQQAGLSLDVWWVIII